MPKLTSFKEFLTLKEDLVTFGNRAYPRFGNVVILAGGAGSGKGFILKNLLGIEGRVMDVDEVKRLALASQNIADRVKRETGEDIRKYNLKNPEDVSKLHTALYSLTMLRQSHLEKILSQVKTKDRLPNVIFDVTMRDWKKFHVLTKFCETVGYEMENIHLVWIVNAIETARRQNKERSRVVRDDILVDTHEGAAKTMSEVIAHGSKIAKFLNGDIWLVFANVDESDTLLKTSEKEGEGFAAFSDKKYSGKKEYGGKYVVKSTKIKIKKAGSAAISKIPDSFLKKLTRYTGQEF